MIPTLAILAHLEDEQIALAGRVQAMCPVVASELRRLSDITASVHAALVAEAERNRPVTRREREGQRKWSAIMDLARAVRLR